MSTHRPECPACRITMQEGFVIDVGDKRLHVTKWCEGHPEKSLMSGIKTKKRRQLETMTFRCPKCGWLIWFAPDAPSTAED
jgi:hypothetical protein